MMRWALQLLQRPSWRMSQASAQEGGTQTEPEGLSMGFWEAKVARIYGPEYYRGRSCTKKVLEISRGFPESGWVSDLCIHMCVETPWAWGKTNPPISTSSNNPSRLFLPILELFKKLSHIICSLGGWLILFDLMFLRLIPVVSE